MSRDYDHSIWILDGDREVNVEEDDSRLAAQERKVELTESGQTLIELGMLVEEENGQQNRVCAYADSLGANV